jgi:DNA-binding NtrC family response regulator
MALTSRPFDPATRSPRIVSVSPAMQDVLRLAQRAAAGDAKVLLTGESGAGKDVIAREVHGASARARGPFVAVNCAGLTETLLESELFGHVKGSFTGAFRDKPGKLELAHRGTLFLDEVGEMSLRMQALLLRFLEQGELQRVGDTGRAARVDVRVVAATNRNLPERVAAGEFREDLLYRLRVIHIHVPPLRDRRDDIVPLAEFFASQRGGARFSDEALALLERYHYPGNVRELQNIVEHAVWQSETGEIGAAHLPPAIRVTEPLVQTRERRRQVADDLYDALVDGGRSFWIDVHPLFLSRDLTRHDVRELVRRGLQTTKGSYRSLLKLFGMDDGDYQRFHNFLATHDCKVDFRDFRNGQAVSASRRPVPLELFLDRDRRQPAADARDTRRPARPVVYSGRRQTTLPADGSRAAPARA